MIIDIHEINLKEKIYDFFQYLATTDRNSVSNLNMKTLEIVKNLPKLNL